MRDLTVTSHLEVNGPSTLTYPGNDQINRNLITGTAEHCIHYLKQVNSNLGGLTRFFFFFLFKVQRFTC